MKDAFNGIANKVRRKNCGRPKKEDAKRRCRKISSAYTEEEFTQLKRQADKAQKSLSVYQRTAALDGKVTAQDRSSGLRLTLLQEMAKQLHYCRAEYHKIERGLAQGTPALTQDRLAAIDEIIAVITFALRKEVGLDPG